jgi:hypothetical protein
MRLVSQNRDSQSGGDCSASLICSTIRRNGNRHQTASPVPRNYALSWRPKPLRPLRSATKVQTRLTPFRPVTCAPGSMRVSVRGTRPSNAGRSRMFGKGVLLAFFVALMGMLAAAQSYAPAVTMSVTLPDGRMQEVTAAESGLATLSLEDGTEYGFRPTIHDNTPWNRIVVTIFRMATTKAPTQLLGEVEVTRGDTAVDSKTNPAFKVAVPKVSPPPTQSSRQARSFYLCDGVM